MYFDGGLRKGCLRLNITFSGYVFILSVKLSSPQKKKLEVYLYRLLTLLPLKTYEFLSIS